MKESDRIRGMPDGNLLLMQLQADIWLEHLKEAIRYCEKMERYYLYLKEHKEG